MSPIASSSKACRSPRLLPSATYAVTKSAMMFLEVLAGKSKDFLVIESQFRRPLQGEPADFRRVIGRLRLHFVRFNPRQVDDGDGSASRVAQRVSEGVQLHEIARLDSGLL